MTIIVKKDEKTLLEASVDAEKLNVQFDLEQSGYTEEGFGTDYTSFTLSKEEALALAAYITKTFS